ncbi:MAG: radical SAM protein [Candidatus Muirbacterium halophilum]|nr:radical SAM protein [Candidatus Muirbacterium halophilum]MCK9474662.1 radical SAM protein [Candidatus Muirbacterium halophilum]
MRFFKYITNFIAVFLNHQTIRNKNFIYYLFYYFSEGFLIFFHKFSFLLKFLQPAGRKYIGWPKLALLHPGIYCNRNCLYCYENSIEFNIEEQLSIDKYKIIIKNLKKLKVTQIQILGREPLLYDKLTKMLDILKKNNLDTVIYTNGLNADINMLKKLLPYKNKISFAWSLESEKVKNGKSNLKLSLANLLLFKKHNFDIKLFITATNVNYKFIPDLLKITYLKHNLIPVFTRYIPCGNKTIDSKFNLSSKQWYKILKVQKKIQKKEKIINIGKISAYIRGYGCSDYFDSIHISYNGKVSPCDYVMSKIIVGDLKTDNIFNIWEKYKKNIKKWNYLPDECKQCKENFYCHGGRKSHSYILFNTFYKIDPLCQNNKCPLSY